MKKVFCNDCIYIDRDGLMVEEWNMYEKCLAKDNFVIITTPFRMDRYNNRPDCSERNKNNNCKYFKRKPL